MTENNARNDNIFGDTGNGRITRDPLPNILRIETLSEAAIKEYVTIYKDAAINLQFGLRKSYKVENDLVFYGFMQNDTISFNVNAEWQPREGAKVTILDTASSLVSGSTKKDESRLGLFDKFKTGTQGVFNLTSKSVSGLEKMGIINATNYGASTQTALINTTLTSNESIKCGWYLPQSLKQAVIGIKTLLEMTYPRPPKTTTYTDLNSFQQTGSDVLKLLASLGDLLTGGEGTGEDGVSTEDADRRRVDLNNKISELNNKLQDNNLLENIAGPADDYLGFTLTTDPLPVRISIGNKAVFEPMVITSLNIKMSKESFLKTFPNSNKKKLLPEFITVDIGYKYWQQPNPLKNKTSLIGLPMFSKQSGKTSTRVDLDDDVFDDIFN